jgi:transketolase
MPSHELFLQQTAEYQASVLPEGVRRIAIEAAHPMSWQRFLRPGDVMIGIDHFGASAPYQRLYMEYGITVEAVVAAASVK